MRKQENKSSNQNIRKFNSFLSQMMKTEFFGLKCQQSSGSILEVCATGCGLCAVMCFISRIGLNKQFSFFLPNSYRVVFAFACADKNVSKVTLMSLSRSSLIGVVFCTKHPLKYFDHILSISSDLSEFAEFLLLMGKIINIPIQIPPISLNP